MLEHIQKLLSFKQYFRMQNFLLLFVINELLTKDNVGYVPSTKKQQIEGACQRN